MRTAFRLRFIERLALAAGLTTGCAASGASSNLVIQVPAADEDAEVFVDGNYVGQVRAIDDRGAYIRLAPGPHRVEIRKPGRFPVQRTVEVGRKPAPQTVVEAELLEDPE